MADQRIRLAAQPRPAPELGTSACRKLRAAGWVPGILYGRGREPQAVKFQSAALRPVLIGHHGTHLLDLTLDGAGPVPVLLKEVQMHPVSDRVLNIDLQVISLTEKVVTVVQVRLVGESPSTRLGGILSQPLAQVEIEALPTDIPDELTLDISGLEIGHALRVSDLQAPAGVTVRTPADEAVAVMSTPKAEEVAPVAEVVVPVEGEAAAEGAAEKPTEGEEKK